MSEKTMLPCPFCGGQPTITKHFKESLWWLKHQCPVMGPLTMDWTDDPARLVTRWNTRHVAVGSEEQ